MGMGLNLYDVMSVDRDRLRSRRGRRARGSAERRSPRRSADKQGDRSPQLEEGESWSPERHRVISGEEVIELLPALAAREPTSGYMFYDCQTDDVRLVLTVLGEAERFGAVCANRLRVTGLLEQDGRTRGVRAHDLEGGGEFVVRADNVVNATGVWADQLRPQELHDAADLAGPDRGEQVSAPFIRPTATPTHALPRGSAAGERRDRARRRGPLDLRAAIVGSHTGRHHRQRLRGRPRARATLRGGHRLPARRRQHILCHRPEPSRSDRRVRRGATADLQRRPQEVGGHLARAELYETASGMLTITGGKLSTWRRMAKLTVDRLVERDAREAPCRTHEIPLGQAIAADELPRVEGVPAESYVALASRYGEAAQQVLALAEESNPAHPELAQPIVPGLPDLLAEVVLAARNEQARSVGDVLLRRTRLGLLAARELPVERVADVLARELGWDAGRVGLEIERFAQEADAEGIIPA